MMRVRAQSRYRRLRITDTTLIPLFPPPFTFTENKTSSIDNKTTDPPSKYIVRGIHIKEFGNDHVTVLGSRKSKTYIYLILIF